MVCTIYISWLHHAITCISLSYLITDPLDLVHLVGVLPHLISHELKRMVVRHKPCHTIMLFRYQKGIYYIYSPVYLVRSPWVIHTSQPPSSPLPHSAEVSACIRKSVKLNCPFKPHLDPVPWTKIKPNKFKTYQPRKMRNIHSVILIGLLLTVVAQSF